MYAVVKTGGKQYVVREGDLLRVEKLPGDKGDNISLNEVLMVAGNGEGTQIGTPLVDGAEVKCEIVAQEKGRKVIVFKHKRRKGYYRTRGHRQLFTGLKVQSISAGKGSKEEA